MKNITLSIIVLTVVIFGLIMAYSNSQSNLSADKSITETTIANQKKIYFDDLSPVMYFWSPLCSWCQKEEVILNTIAKDGFRVKSMNVYEDSSLYDKYTIDGTPSIISEGGEKLVGYQEEVTLRDWLKKQGAKIK